jgi:putative membrane protein insertion efficiency factor
VTGSVTAPARLAMAAIRGYQRWVAPLLPPVCRYWPTCSEYARLAIDRRGLLRGGAAALARIVRCQPLLKGFIDPH